VLVSGLLVLLSVGGISKRRLEGDDLFQGEGGALGSLCVLCIAGGLV
jgi:hypothetical protein